MSRARPAPPRFIALDGPDGCGKSTQLGMLARLLTRRSIPHRRVRDPGGTPAGEKIRRILLRSAPGSVAPVTELFLYLAARAQLVEDRIRPALAEGRWVLSDRFFTATVAYQGYGDGRAPRRIERLCREGTGGLVPDLTVILDLPPEIGLARCGKHDRMEKKGLAYHRRVRKGFREQALRRPRRIRLVDARGDPDAVHTRIVALLARWIPA